MYLSRLLNFLIEGSAPLRRAGGLSRNVDFIMSNVTMTKL